MNKFTAQEIAYGGEQLDGEQLDFVLTAANTHEELINVLQECIDIYEKTRNNQPTGHLWPDPNYITHARAAIQKATDYGK